MQFTRLRLSGFKSFVDHTELPIEAGMTGVVGPNGCGKSNLLEALRWVMGETSAKQMRGGGMEDVIFNGTSTRPARNVAEVLLRLDNRERHAPAMFNDSEDLDVSRRIERGAGSLYKVNGKEVRARDVQLLFADAASGARSTALVSQGRIGAVVNAKPVQRRVLLEEAAGITGLHSRRHEAELRLKAAEGNLERLEDVLVTMEAQLSNLKKQARQATRYRNLSDHIRTAEAALFAVRWEEAITGLDTARSFFEETEALATACAAKTAQAATDQANAAAVLPDLRAAEAASAAAVQRLVVEREGLDAEEARVKAAQETTEQRIAQIDGDMDRERRHDREAQELASKLEEERSGLVAEQAGEAAARESAQARVDQCAAEVQTLEGSLSSLTQSVAETEARRNALDRRITELGQRLQRLNDRAAALATQRESLATLAVSADALSAAQEDLVSRETALDSARGAVDAAQTAQVQAREQVEAAVQEARQADSELTRIDAEISALADVLESNDPDLWPPLIDSLTVEPGYETALGAALGEDLSAAADTAAPIHWRVIDGAEHGPTLPGGCQPLAQYARGATLLSRRLAQIGVVESNDEGIALARLLQQGQRLVSREGALWRWDGYTIAAGAPTAAATRLRQRNRLVALRDHDDAAQRRLNVAEEKLAALRAVQADADAQERDARDQRRAADTALAAAREAEGGLRRKAAEQDAKLNAAVEAISGVQQELDAATSALQAAREEYGALPDTEAARQEMTALREDLAGKRTVLSDAQAALTGIVREAESRARRIAAIGREQEAWTARQQAAVQQLAALTERMTAAAAELEQLKARPAQIAVNRDRLAEAMVGAEEKRRAAADALAVAERRQSETDLALREATKAESVAREERVRAEAAVAQGKESCRVIAEQIAERLDCAPDGARPIAGLGADDPTPDRAPLESKLERLLREREGMGPVNLRAEQEAEELSAQIEGLVAERVDLVKAIEKLRRAIGELNREGRERLLASFKAVDAHFRDLFTRLFGGGTATLELTDSDDPLQAGLELIAAPPGKRPQSLSLLSGGEQALTALSLLFAVFMTNPAPICVLDEVDAPLDDANVDRFCGLLDEMVAAGSTRFLVITHHRMTMARMDRLFGVTMTERGVSQLVSVDLRQAEGLTAA
ncbi:MAG: AAA family ATPase [Magnetospiraceae bacterium]